MNYALIEAGVVTNIIWLYEGNEGDFPNAVKLNDLPVGIGDSYADGVFTRNGEAVRTPLAIAEETISQLDAAVVELEYSKTLLELGVAEGG